MRFFNFFKKSISRDASQLVERKYTKKSYNNSYPFSIDSILTKSFNNGLLPGEVLLIYWISGNHYTTDFPRYFKTIYGIDAKRSLEKLFIEGYIEEANAINTLNYLKLPELKEILKLKGLKRNGKKVELIGRIIECFTENEIEAFIDNRIIQITDKGDKVLAEYYYIVPAHRNDTKDGVYNVANAIRHVSKLNYKPHNGDISWALFQQSHMEHARKFQYGLMRNDIRNMAAQLESEKKYKGALFHYLNVYIIDTSGLCNSPRLEHPRSMMYEVPSKYNIKKLTEILEYEDSVLKDFFVDTWSKTRPGLKYHYLSVDKCFQCLTFSLQDNDEQVKEALFIAYYSLKKEMDKKTFKDKYFLEFPIDFEGVYR